MSEALIREPRGDAFNPDDPGGFDHRLAECNGVRLHYVEAGEGPLVILLHGFPYLWYLWRRQIPALAAAGYRVVAPDQRGFGQSERPDAVEAYDVLQSVGDVVGLMKALGETSAVLVGHDVGAWIAYASAQLRPDLFRALALLNTPIPPRGGSRPTEAMKALAAKGVMTHHYYFQEPGKADRELDYDPRRSLASIHYSVSGAGTDGGRWNPLIPVGGRLIDTLRHPTALPAWLSPQALDYYTAEYARSGFTGPLNYYRCRDRNWELTSFLDGAPVRQPSLFIGGADDPLRPHFQALYDTLESHMPCLVDKALLPGVGHSAPEESPQDLNIRLLAFLAQLDGEGETPNDRR